jgi:hypothetical protein
MHLKLADVLAMPAGNTIDDLVQEHVFGYQGACEDGTWYVIPPEPYSTEKECAQRIVTSLPTRDNETFSVIKDGSVWTARYDCLWDNKKYRKRTTGTHVAHGDTMPLAVCRAALMAFCTED